MTQQTKWSIDQAHTEIAFKVRHLMISHVKGSFKTFDGNIYTNGKDFRTAEIDIWIDPASISTGDSKRDAHLIGEDFFDVKTFKQIVFVSITIGESNKEGVHELWGELTMKGITKNVKLEVGFGGIVNDPWGNERAGFTVSGKINRNDWGLNWNTAIEAGGVMVSEEVTISCDIELTNIGFKDLKMEVDSVSDKASL
jgi:polyisoprenoid-binding protein YceI